MELNKEQKRKKNADAQKRWRLKNPLRAKEFVKNAQAKNPEKYREMQKKKYLRWKTEKPEQLKAMRQKAGKKYALKKTWLLPENREKDRLRARIWRLKHPGETTKRVADWRKAHPEESKANRRAWAKSNPEKNRISHQNNEVKRRGVVGKFTAAEWRAKKKEFNHTCPSCGVPEPTIKLTVDHILPIILGGTNFIENIQPLCGPCNSRKNAKFLRFEPIVV